MTEAEAFECLFDYRCRIWGLSGNSLGRVDPAVARLSVSGPWLALMSLCAGFLCIALTLGESDPSESVFDGVYDTTA
jgi:hypothetical protein